MDQALDGGVGEVLVCAASEEVALDHGALIPHQDLLSVDEGNVADNALGLTQDGEHLGDLGHAPESQAASMMPPFTVPTESSAGRRR